MVIWNPFASINALLMLVGVALIYDGVSDLVILFQLTRTFRKVKEAAEEILEQAAEEADVIESEGRVER